MGNGSGRAECHPTRAQGLCLLDGQVDDARFDTRARLARQLGRVRPLVASPSTRAKHRARVCVHAQAGSIVSFKLTDVV